jgi:hypothetical protein
LEGYHHVVQREGPWKNDVLTFFANVLKGLTLSSVVTIKGYYMALQNPAISVTLSLTILNQTNLTVSASWKQRCLQSENPIAMGDISSMISKGGRWRTRMVSLWSVREICPQVDSVNTEDLKDTFLDILLKNLALISCRCLKLYP